MTKALVADVAFEIFVSFRVFSGQKKHPGHPIKAVIAL
jgi:hypothetical protein